MLPSNLRYFRKLKLGFIGRIATHFSHKAERAPFFSHDHKFYVTAYTGNIQKYDLGHKHRRDMYLKNNRIR